MAGVSERTDWTGLGGIFVRVNPERFAAGVALARAIGDRYDPDSQTWHVPERHAGRVPYQTPGASQPVLLYDGTDGMSGDSMYHSGECSCDRCAGLIADHGEPGSCQCRYCAPDVPRHDTMLGRPLAGCTCPACRTAR